MGAVVGYGSLNQEREQMELRIVSQNMELPPAAHRYMERKLGKLNRHLPSLIISRVEVIEEKTKSPQHRYVVQVTLESNGTLLRGEGRGKELFTAIDKVAEIMKGQIEHHKGKLYEKGRGSSLARSKFGEGVEATEPPGKVVKVKRFAIKPMPVSEAIDQMELLGHDFFLFLNADTEEVNLLYRRKDGNYGQIEPELG